MNKPVYEYDTKYKSDFFREVPTCALVEELQRREGVTAKTAGPEEAYEASGVGPAIVLVVRD